MKACYNCGKDFESELITSEHIPPRCFSDVYGYEFKKNRITVDCCLTCNQEYSKIDDELRDMIAILKDGDDGNNNFLKKGIKSIIRKKIFGKDYTFNNRNKQYEILFNYELIEKLFMKCHKGIFFAKYGYPVDKNFISKAHQKNINDSHDNPIHLQIENLHKQNYESFIISGHQDIFCASILAFKKGQNGLLEITQEIENCLFVSTYLIFHKRVDCIVVGINKRGEYYNLIENKEIAK